MSEIFVDTLRKTGGSLGTDIRIKNTSVYESDGGTSVTQNLVQGVAKAWSDHKTAATFVLEDSLNVSSLSDIGLGGSDVNLTNNMSSEHNSCTCGAGLSDTLSGVIIPDAWIHSTSSYKTATFWVNSTYYDAIHTHATLHGDLA